MYIGSYSSAFNTNFQKLLADAKTNIDSKDFSSAVTNFNSAYKLIKDLKSPVSNPSSDDITSFLETKLNSYNILIETYQNLLNIPFVNDKLKSDEFIKNIQNVIEHKIRKTDSQDIKTKLDSILNLVKENRLKDSFEGLLDLYVDSKGELEDSERESKDSKNELGKVIENKSNFEGRILEILANS